MSSSAARTAASAAEIDAAVSKLTTYRNVTGYLVLSRPRRPEDPPALIRLGGPEFDGALAPAAQGDADDDDDGPSPQPQSQQSSKKRDQVKAVINLVAQTLGGLAEAAEDLDRGDLRFVRLRLATREVMIAPSPDFVLAVVQDPTVPP